MILIDATDRGFLNDTVRDVLAVAGCILAIIPLLPSKKLVPPNRRTPPTTPRLIPNASRSSRLSSRWLYRSR